MKLPIGTNNKALSFCRRPKIGFRAAPPAKVRKYGDVCRFDVRLKRNDPSNQYASQAAEVQHVQAQKTLADQHAAELARLNAGIEGDRSRHLQEIEQIRAELAQQKQTTQATASERDQVRAELITVGQSRSSEPGAPGATRICRSGGASCG